MRVRSKALLPCVHAPAWPGQCGEPQHGPSILIPPLQCCFTPDFHTLFPAFSSHHCVLMTGTGAESPHVAMQIVPGLKCHQGLPVSSWTLPGTPQVNVTAWPGLVSGAPYMSGHAGGSCQLQDISNNEWDYPGAESGLLDPQPYWSS